MFRRIALTVAALIAALLVLAVVPLGLSVTANERSSFRFDTRSAAAEFASQAEEYLADHHAPTAMYTALKAAAAHGDCAAVFRPNGAEIAATSCADTTWSAVRPAAGAVAGDAESGSDVSKRVGSWLRVTVAVGDTDESAGSVVYARSADALDDRIADMWGWLALSGLAVLLLGILLAVRLARWVAGPLETLDATAARLGTGALDARAEGIAGPREVRRLADTFNAMASRTQALVHSHRGWVADVSHQLRTPLTALRLRLDVLAAESDAETARELDGVQEEIARLSRLVDGLLAVARAEAATPSPEAIRADAVAAERVAAWEPVARERGVTLNLADPAREHQIPAAYLAPGDLEQILDNLLANALDAVPDGGRVTVHVEPSDRAGSGSGASSANGGVSLRVSDDGPGMDDAAKSAAFRRFGRFAQGSGLGLAIVHRLVTIGGGTIRLVDTPGGGLTVELGLPSPPTG